MLLFLLLRKNREHILSIDNLTIHTMALPETTLSNPLLSASYTHFLEMYGGVRPPDRTEVGRAVRALQLERDSPHLDLIQQHRAFLTPPLSRLGQVLVPQSVGRAYLQEVGLLCQEQQNSIQKFLQSRSSTPMPPLPFLKLEGIGENQELLGHLQLALYWLNVVDHIVLGAKRGRWIRWEGGWFSRRLSLVPLSGRYVLMSTDACLMMKDMLYSRFIIHLYCHLDPTRTHLGKKLDQFVEWGAALLSDLGDPGYEVLKGIESLTQTALIAREEDVLDGKSQHASMLTKYKEREIGLGGSGAHVEALEQYLSSFSSSRDLAEAFGFLKLWGHPYVDPVAGCISARDLAQASLRLDPAHCLRLEWSFCHIYCRGYLRKRGRWPPLAFAPSPSGEPTRLERLYQKSHPSLAFGFTQYDPSDWQWARFLPHQMFDMGEDILSLVVDKSLSYDRDHFDATWGGRLDYRPPRPPTSSRVMEELITRPEIDLPSIVERVSTYNIPRKWKIVTVCPKEREMKLQPRMFSMMVLEMRLFFVLTEHNIAKGIFSNLPEQTMTLSRQELLSLFLTSSRPTPDSWVRAVLGIDFSRWNLRWREETVHPIGGRLDQIYGKPGVFSVVHRFFKDSLCLLRLPDYPPDLLNRGNRHDPPEGRTLWYDHKGGFEGIAQKLWTSCTIALIHMALWPLGLSYRIIGQGDNQVCILEIYVPRDMAPERSKQYVRSLVDRAARSISEVSAKVGQIVKPEECIYSTCFLTYGKEMILRGAYLPTSLKYVSRMFPSTTSDSPSLYEMISGISSGASGATERNDWSYPTYFLAKIMEGLTLSREFRRSLFHGDFISSHIQSLQGPATSCAPDKERALDLLRLSLAIPSNLGGFPITTVPEMMYRGHSDPLTSSLLHLCFLENIPAVNRYRQVLWKGWPLDSNPDPVGLIQDPYSIPLRSVPVPSSQVAAATSSILPALTHNRQFQELLAKSTDQDKQNLIDWLSSTRPFNPKVAHDLYKSSLVGLRDAFSRRFSNTRTILSLSRKAGISISEVSLSSDRQFLKGVLFNLHLTWKVDPTYPSFQASQLYWVASTLRRAWFQGTPLVGVTNAHPLAVGKLHWIPEGGAIPPPPPCLVAVALTSYSSSGLSTRGSSTPYLGSATSDKSVAKWVRPIDTSPPLKDVLKILTIRETMTVPGSPFHEGLTRLAESRTYIPVAILEKLVRLRIGGTDAHRYFTRDESRGSFWSSCFNWPSHLTFSTNLAGDLGARDYPYDFQEAMLTMAVLTSWTYSRWPTRPPWGLCLSADLTCMEEVGNWILDTPPTLPTFSLGPPNYYAVVLEVLVSSRAPSAAQFQSSTLTLPWARAAPSIHHAASLIFLSHFRRGGPVTTRYGHSIGIPSSRRIIDLPELTRLTTTGTLDSLAEALWLKVGLTLSLLCSRRGRTPSRLLRSLLDLEVRRGIPGLSGTLREVEGGFPLFGLGIGLGRENEAHSLAKWMALCLDRCHRTFPTGPFFLFERGSASVSSTLSSYLGVMAARECLSNDPHRFSSGKLLARVTRRCMEVGEEMDRVRLLGIVIRTLGVGTHFRVVDTSPDEVLRTLREGEPGLSSLGGTKVRRVYTPPLITGEGVGGPASLVLKQTPLDPPALLESWYARDPVLPAPAERWAPLSSLLSGPKRVLLLGVGQGDIGPALPAEWEVTGVELASSLPNLGHNFTTYRPPSLPNPFRLHPCSWTTSGDVTTPQVQDLLKGEIKASRYDLGLIDIEGVDNHLRLQLRSTLAGWGLPTYCKVLLHPQDVPLFLQSWVAYHGPDDHIWTTLSYPGREFVVGPSSSPVGVYAAVPLPNPPIIQVPLPTPSDLLVEGFASYSPGPDFLTLTGHFEAPTQEGLWARQCRGLFPFVTGSSRPSLPFQTVRGACLHLLSHKCPRSRVRALVRLDQAHLLAESFLDDLSRLHLQTAS